MFLTAASRCLLVLGIAAGIVSPAMAGPVPDWWTAPLGGVAPLTDSLPAAADSPAGSDMRRADPAAIDCLAKAIAYEAGNEPLPGRQAVAQVILNRTRHRAFPKTICGVVFQGSERRTGCQFTFTCDGSLRRALSLRTWDAALAVARQAVTGQLPPTIGAATHYHADYVSPRWAPSLVRVAAVGAHIFYRFPGAGLDSGVYGAASAARSAADAAPTGPQDFSLWGLRAANMTQPGS